MRLCDGRRSHTTTSPSRSPSLTLIDDLILATSGLNLETLEKIEAMVDARGRVATVGTHSCCARDGFSPLLGESCRTVFNTWRPLHPGRSVLESVQ